MKVSTPASLSVTVSQLIFTDVSNDRNAIVFSIKHSKKHAWIVNDKHASALKLILPKQL
jgi:hypothetical protein